MMEKETNIESLRFLAIQAGLNLSEEELVKMLPGLNRTQGMARALRPLLRNDLEPVMTFRAIAIERGRR